MLKQRTLSSSITATGVGLHTGKKINLRINPGQPDRGIVFVRTDMTNEPIKASLKNVHDTRLSTTISNGSASVSTVEHLLSALAGLGIDNATIELLNINNVYLKGPHHGFNLFCYKGELPDIILRGVTFVNAKLSPKLIPSKFDEKEFRPFV